MRPTRGAAGVWFAHVAGESAANQTEYSDHAEYIRDHGRDGAAHAALPHFVGEQERNHQQMRQGQPHCTQLQQAGGFGIEDAARDVHVRDCVSVEQHVSALEICQKRHNGNASREPDQESNLGVPGGIRGRDFCLFRHRRLGKECFTNEECSSGQIRARVERFVEASYCARLALSPLRGLFFSLFAPTAYAVGFILAPLRG